MSFGADLSFADPNRGTFPGLDCLALAERQGVPTVTADRRLHGRCMAGAAVRWGSDQTAGGQDWRARALTLTPDVPGTRDHFSDQAETQCEGETKGRSEPHGRVAGSAK